MKDQKFNEKARLKTKAGTMIVHHENRGVLASQIALHRPYYIS
jgi:hypothetical protein